MADDGPSGVSIAGGSSRASELSAGTSKHLRISLERRLRMIAYQRPPQSTCASGTPPLRPGRRRGQTARGARHGDRVGGAPRPAVARGAYIDSHDTEAYQRILTSMLDTMMLHNEKLGCIAQAQPDTAPMALHPLPAAPTRTDPLQVVRGLQMHRRRAARRPQADFHGRLLKAGRGALRVRRRRSGHGAARPDRCGDLRAARLQHHARHARRGWSRTSRRARSGMDPGVALVVALRRAVDEHRDDQPAGRPGAAARRPARSSAC